jgi:hypothetical protein
MARRIDEEESESGLNSRMKSIILSISGVGSGIGGVKVVPSLN